MQPEIEKYRAQGLQFILITADSKEIMQGVVEQYDLDVMILHDPQDQIAFAHGIQSWPTGLIFNREGHLEHKMNGWSAESSLHAWRAQVEAILRQE